MDRFARNRRLFDNLFAMGLFVDAVLVDDNPDKIDALLVSTAPRTVDLLPSNVGSPVQRPEVGKSVGSAESDRDNVVNFPTVVGVPVAIRRE